MAAYMPVYQLLTHPSSEKLLTIAGNPHRDPKQDNGQGVRDFGSLSPK